ncbi:MAG: hypothetical protein KJ072_27800, partial [Verrucomicrobia bacterium]|nr:hypothetical protein [Verrucomicrobiota bacterium]
SANSATRASLTINCLQLARRPFPKVPCLLQYISNGKYYARARVNGKLIRESLKTATWSIAKLRLTDFLKKHQEARGTIAAPIRIRAQRTESVLKDPARSLRMYCREPSI